MFDEFGPLVIERFSDGTETLLPVGYALDLEYGFEAEQVNQTTGYRDLSENEPPFSSGPQEFVDFDDLESAGPGFETVADSRRNWSTFGQGMSLKEFAINDMKTTFFNLDDDFRGLWRPRNVIFLGAGLGLALGLRDSVDEDTRGWVSRHPKRWSSFTESLGILGNTEYQIAAIFALYGYSFRTENAELMEFTQLLIRTYTLTGLSTIALKLIADTDRPSVQWMDGRFGFPSAHSSTSFAIAATIDEYYGPRLGIPAYIMAGLIGWSRVDEQDHDVSDVVFGAFLGYTIAKSVSGSHLRGDSRIRLFPWTDPSRGTYGALFEVDY